MSHMIVSWYERENRKVVESLSENREWRRRCDVERQVVPDGGTSQIAYSDGEDRRWGVFGGGCHGLEPAPCVAFAGDDDRGGYSADAIRLKCQPASQLLASPRVRADQSQLFCRNEITCQMLSHHAAEAVAASTPTAAAGDDMQIWWKYVAIRCILRPSTRLRVDIRAPWPFGDDKRGIFERIFCCRSQTAQLNQSCLQVPKS